MIKKGLINKNIIKLDFKVGKSKKYKIEVIQKGVVYTKKLKKDYLLRLYYHVF